MNNPTRKKNHFIKQYFPVQILKHPQNEINSFEDNETIFLSPLFFYYYYYFKNASNAI